MCEAFKKYWDRVDFDVFTESPRTTAEKAFNAGIDAAPLPVEVQAVMAILESSLKFIHCPEQREKIKSALKAAKERKVTG